MSKQYYLYIDGKAVSVTKEVYDAYWQYTEKEDYFMRRLKSPSRMQGSQAQTFIMIPARESSLDDYLDYEHLLASDSPSVEELVLSAVWLEDLLNALTEEEREIVRHFYIQGKTVREVCSAMGLPRSTFSDREKRLRKKLGTLLKKFF